MPRTTNAVPRHARKHRMMKLAKGYRGGRSKLLRTAKETIAKALRYARADRRSKKRDFRGLWIIRLSAALEQHGIMYSRFIAGLKKANILLNRKELSEMAIHDVNGFTKVVDLAKQALAKK